MSRNPEHPSCPPSSFKDAKVAEPVLPGDDVKLFNRSDGTWRYIGTATDLPAPEGCIRVEDHRSLHVPAFQIINLAPYRKSPYDERQHKKDED